MTARLITMAFVAACWPLWWLAGWIADRVGLDDLDVLLRVVFLIVCLCAAELVLSRLPPPRNH